MTFFDTPLGHDLDTALAGREDGDVGLAVDAVLDAIWEKNLAPDQVEQAITALQSNVEFSHAITVGDAALGAGLATYETRRRYSQALIEIGALTAAESELARLEAEPEIPAKERGEALGLLGRLQKQRYLLTGDAAHLTAAVDTYATAYEGGTDRLWHGINLVALMNRMEEDGHGSRDDLPTVSEMAQDLVTTVHETPENQRFVWDLATEIEALVALGQFEKAQAVAEALADSKRADAFQLGSLRRQLIEVWRLDQTHPVVLAVNDQILQHGGPATLDLPDSPVQFEKIFGAALPIGYNTLLKGLRCAQSVCKITDINGEGWGTGFLADGSVFHDSLSGVTLIVTNAHVVSSTQGVGVLQPVEAQARFDILRGEGDEQLQITELTEVWTSPPSRCDVTLLRFDGDPPVLHEPITKAPALPLAGDGAFVYVVGHPAGAGLKLSIRGNDLLAYEKPGSKVHYMAPTEPGSSGSPVFTAQWQLMAVHHAGSSKLRRLDDPTKTYEANEGITLQAIQAEFAATYEA